MDSVDLVVHQEEMLMDHFIKPVTYAVSSNYCAGCEEPIPEARRVALPGVRLCKECAEDYERKSKV